MSYPPLRHAGSGIEAAVTSEARPDASTRTGRSQSIVFSPSQTTRSPMCRVATEIVWPSIVPVSRPSRGSSVRAMVPDGDSPSRAEVLVDAKEVPLGGSVVLPVASRSKLALLKEIAVRARSRPEDAQDLAFIRTKLSTTDASD